MFTWWQQHLLSCLFVQSDDIHTVQNDVSIAIEAALFTWWQQRLLACLLMCLKEAAGLDVGALQRSVTHPAGSQAAAASIHTLTRALLCTWQQQKTAP
jgi:hypothetical protein